MELNVKNLEKIVKKLADKVSFQKETGQLVATFKANLIEYPVFLKTIQENTLLQIIMFLPCKPVEKTLGDTLKLLNFFNREIDLPGFCYDDASQLIFYRISLPAFDQKMPETIIIEKIFAILPNIAATFVPLTQLVCEGIKNYASIREDFYKASGKPA